MKQLHLLLIVLVVFVDSSQLLGQYGAPCGTTFAEQVSTPSFVAMNRSFTLPPQGLIVHEIPVQFHIIGAFNGAFAIDSAIIFQELDRTNDLFAEINLEFVHCGLINYINDNEYVTFTKGVDEVICDLEDVPNAINIYFAFNVENTAEESLCGYAYNFDIKNRVVMDNSCASNGSTLTHELGHSFSLLHTHSTSNGEELVNGSNCSTAGDLHCDTPADPRLNTTIVNEDCTYTGSEVDMEGQDYDPDTSNLMSYSRKECRTHFSTEQLNQMAAYFLLEGGFLICNNDQVNTDTPLAHNLAVYPNPGLDQVYVQGLTAPATIRICDTNGRVPTIQARGAISTFCYSRIQPTPGGHVFLVYRVG